MKKLTVVLVILLVAVSMAPCLFNFKTSKTETKTETKADGSSVTETYTETKENGKFSSETTREFYRKSVPWDLVNNTDFDWYELYITVGDSEDWGENLMEDGAMIPVGETASGLTVSFTQDTLFNVKVADYDGYYVYFNSISFAAFEEDESITTKIEVNEDGSYSLRY